MKIYPLSIIYGKIAIAGTVKTYDGICSAEHIQIILTLQSVIKSSLCISNLGLYRLNIHKLINVI